MRELGFERFSKKHAIFFAAILLIIALDQGVKLWILGLAKDSHVIFESRFIDIVLVFNKGIAFSFFSALGGGLKWLILAMLLFMAIFVLKSEEIFTRFFAEFGVIIGAGFSNLVDRFARSGVVDYIYWHYGFNFAIFNLADALINISIALIILRYLLKR